MGAAGGVHPAGRLPSALSRPAGPGASGPVLFSIKYPGKKFPDFMPDGFNEEERAEEGGKEQLDYIGPAAGIKVGIRITRENNDYQDGYIQRTGLHFRSACRMNRTGNSL
jgi:hypothetical protein